MSTHSSGAGRPRRVLGTAAALVAVSLGLAGCAGEPAAEGPVTLEFWTWSLKEADPAAQAIVDQYEAENPGVTIKLSEVGGTPRRRPSCWRPTAPTRCPTSCRSSTARCRRW